MKSCSLPSGCRSSNVGIFASAQIATRTANPTLHLLGGLGPAAVTLASRRFGGRQFLATEEMHPGQTTKKMAVICIRVHLCESVANNQHVAVNSVAKTALGIKERRWLEL